MDYLREPLVPEELRSRIRDALKRREAAEEVVDRLVWAGKRKHGLTEAEAGIVELRLQGFDGPAIARIRGISMNTLKTQNRGVLRKGERGSGRRCGSLTEYCDQLRLLLVS